MAKYINRLTNEEIEEFFNMNGYKLCKELKDNNGLPIDAIERGEETIFVRAQQLRKENIDIHLAYYLLKKHPGFITLPTLATMGDAYSRNIDLIHFSDFFLSKFCISREEEKESEELCTSYLKYMMNKFPTYKQDFLAYCETLPDDTIIEEQSM